ncbi:carbohydrate ABC transporter substrate-binding protein, CUT1 family [Kytococcus aerolatus]|uniref:Carbohydrate ABC transporter substrate-binding protein, CUT1 family n=1 Tax=Kytococcus aerolatus TaxID=592308 RepID=A0A212T9W9_9MICO|nr:extracellular solute-binding protein [Kytococcus aerolatus]SNC62626.1 carbohydrate ABC transporter substrate-binding protein, CUT1 family [Kytococcus aerolatus]
MGRRAAATRIVAGAALATTVVTGCGGSTDSAEGPTELTWYINPDGGGNDPNGGGQAQIARECTEAADGAYSIRTELLPNSATDQRVQLLRRVAAGDPGVDIMSLDPPYLAEFANAGYLADVPKELEKEFTEDRVQSAIEASTWEDELVAVPFWANTQVLWYRKSVAEKAGLDMSKPVTWDQIIDAAEKSDRTVGVQAKPYEGYAVWINALVEGAGGQIIENPGAPAEETELGLDSQAGQDAAAVIQKISTTGVGGPAMGTADETVALNLFQSTKSSGFLVNWPYVWAALPANGVKFIDDVGWARYPQTVEGQESAPPFGGIELGVNAASDAPEEAYDAIRCITDEEHQKLYMEKTGNPASRKAVFDDEAIKEQFPMAPLIRESLDAAKPRPQSQFYSDISTGLQKSFSPPNEVSPESTPADAQEYITEVITGKRLL